MATFSIFDVKVKDLLCGGVSGAIAKNLVAPFELQGRIPREIGVYWRASMLWHTVSKASSFAFYHGFKQEYFIARGEKVHQLFIFGGAAGLLTMGLAHSFDYARLLLAADALKPAGERELKGTFDAILKGLPKPDLSGPRPFRISVLYPTFQGITTHRCVYFGLYDTLKLAYSNNGGSDLLSFLERCAFAQASAVTAGLLAQPYDTARRHLLVAPRSETFIGFVTTTIKEKGFKGFYPDPRSMMLSATCGALALILFDELQILYKKLFPLQAYYI